MYSLDLSAVMIQNQCQVHLHSFFRTRIPIKKMFFFFTRWKNANCHQVYPEWWPYQKSPMSTIGDDMWWTPQLSLTSGKSRHLWFWDSSCCEMRQRSNSHWNGNISTRVFIVRLIVRQPFSFGCDLESTVQKRPAQSLIHLIVRFQLQLYNWFNLVPITKPPPTQDPWAQVTCLDATQVILWEVQMPQIA